MGSRQVVSYTRTVVNGRTHMNRRQLIRTLAGAGLLPLLGGLTGLLPGSAHARVPAAFAARDAGEALALLFDEARIEPSTELELIAPDIAENAALVEIEIRSTLEPIDYLAVIATGNPRPLVAAWHLDGRVALPLGLRVRLAESQEVVVIARSGDRLYSVRKPVQVTIGACGV